ncbi:unnamed protein product [Ectocarpus sp. 8 AP-2014]
MNACSNADALDRAFVPNREGLQARRLRTVRWSGLLHVWQGPRVGGRGLLRGYHPRAGGDKNDGTTPSPVTPSEPTSEPTSKPTPAPEARTTASPVTTPTAEPTSKPTPAPEARATPSPVTEPTAEPTSKLTPAPEARTTPSPVTTPTAEPTSKLTPAPEARTTPSPVTTPTAEPTSKPTPAPEAEPATAPSGGGGHDPGEYQELLERHNQIRRERVGRVHARRRPPGLE